jgi:hypothetical protein
MESDFYDCADLIDEMKKLQAKHEEDILKAERLSGQFTWWCSFIGIYVSLCADLFKACEVGDLVSVKKLLPHVRQALNEFLGTGKNNLLMW